ncbi:paraquat-inducible protein A [Kaarinaea lacus]
MSITTGMNMSEAMAIDQHLVLCDTCHKLQSIRDVDTQHESHCVRCGDPLHYRKPNSITNAWALLFTGIICLVPAQLWPMMKIGVLGNTSSDSIMSGVITLMQMGSYLVAIVVFIASVFVPITKALVLMLILLSVQFRWKINNKQRLIMYRFLEWIGRWSMLDIFVVAIMAALVKITGLAEISAGAGATAFALAVVFTMFAANTFDTRLIWDSARN